MDRQSMMPGDGGGSGAATQEWLYPGAGGGGGQPAQVVDGTFLMDLLEDAPATDQPQDYVDQLSRVIQSLEAEIDGRPTALLAPANGGSSKTENVSNDVDGGGLLDDMLLELDNSPGPCVAEALPPFEYWAEVGHDMVGGWYLDGEGDMVGGYEFIREQGYYGYGESLAVDQVYSPLWE